MNSSDEVFTKAMEGSEKDFETKTVLGSSCNTLCELLSRSIYRSSSLTQNAPARKVSFHRIYYLLCR